MRKNTADKIWSFIEKKSENDCWIYKGGTFHGRYGRFFFEGKPYLAHRFVYELMFGEIVKGLFVMHKCNNKLCCNPNHLTTGTNSENQRHAITSRAFKVGKSGIPGISFDEKRGYWKAGGYEKGRLRNLYTGPSKEKALKAREKWELEYGISFEKEI